MAPLLFCSPQPTHVRMDLATDNDDYFGDEELDPLAMDAAETAAQEALSQQSASTSPNLSGSEQPPLHTASPSGTPNRSGVFNPGRTNLTFEHDGKVQGGFLSISRSAEGTRRVCLFYAQEHTELSCTTPPHRLSLPCQGLFPYRLSTGRYNQTPQAQNYSPPFSRSLLSPLHQEEWDAPPHSQCSATGSVRCDSLWNRFWDSL